MRFPGTQKLARSASDWVDLQWSYMIEQLRRAAPRAKGRLIDVGCGDKPYEHIFAPYVTEYIGVEHTATFEATSASTKASKPDVYYDGVTLPFPDESADTVLNIQVLEHTPRPQQLLKEMARILKPDGVLILCAPFSFRLHEEPHDYFRFTPHGLRAMFEEAGLVITEVCRQGDLWSVLAHKLNTFLAFRVAQLDDIGQALGKLGHEGKNGRAPRVWTLPAVVPAMLAVSAGARVLDRIAPDGTEMLSNLVFARRAPRAA
jgi:SAM-dependent methyltransferase